MAFPLHKAKIGFSDGTEVDNFSEWAITLDMLSPGSAWTLNLWRKDASGTAWNELRERALAGTQCYIYIDDKLQLSGRVEERHTEYSAREGGALVISGRDLAGTALSWHADPKIQIRNRQLEDVVVDLFEPLGITVFPLPADSARTITSTGRKPSSRRRRSNTVDRLKIQPGETVWQVLDRLCKRYGYLAWTGPDPSGEAGIGLIIDAPQEQGVVDFQLRWAIESGSVYTTRDTNILSAKHTTNIRDIPTQVTCFGHTSANAGQDAKQKAVATNTLSHSTVASDLPIQPVFMRSQHARTVANARKEAERFIAKAMANFRTYECTVPGHGQETDGQMKLFAVNAIAHVRDEFHDIDESMLITRVNFTQSIQNGTTTSLKLSPLGAIRVIPEES